MKEAGITKGTPAPERANTRGRAFLVQVSPECQPGAGTIRGRVQHLDTADGGNFSSADDLVAIVARILSRSETD